MTVDSWLEHALRDAERRGLPALRPLLEALARATSALRSAEWNGAEWDTVDRKDAGSNDAGLDDGAARDGRASTSMHEH